MPGSGDDGEAGAAPAGEHDGAVLPVCSDTNASVALAGGRALAHLRPDERRLASLGVHLMGAHRAPPEACPQGEGKKCYAETPGAGHSMAWSWPSLVRMYRRPLANTGLAWMGSSKATFQRSSPLERSSA